MSTFQILIVAVLLAALFAWWWQRRRGSGNGGNASEKDADRIDTVIGWPPKATRVFTSQERLAFNTLVRALPEHMILSQVPLSRFLSVPKRNSYADWLRRIGYQCADFLVCDTAAQVVAVVEVQPLQTNERVRKRLTRMSRTLKAAKIPLQIWTEGALPSVEAAREAILPKPADAPAVPTGTPEVAAAAPTATAAATAGAVAANPFDDFDRDSAHDERIELLEPPPSTWFDDLDSDTVPLGKN